MVAIPVARCTSSLAWKRSSAKGALPAHAVVGGAGATMPLRQPQTKRTPRAAPGQALLDHAWGGSAGVDAIVTASVLAASRPSVSAASSGRLLLAWESGSLVARLELSLAHEGAHRLLAEPDDLSKRGTPREASLGPGGGEVTSRQPGGVADVVQSATRRLHFRFGPTERKCYATAAQPVRLVAQTKRRSAASLGADSGVGGRPSCSMV